MRHELAYILGQMQIPSVSPVLCAVVDDETEDVLVRHEVLLTLYMKYTPRMKLCPVVCGGLRSAGQHGIS